MTPADNSPPPIALRTNSNPAKPPGVALPLAAFLACLALLLAPLLVPLLVLELGR